MPKGAIYVGRPSRDGNEFRAGYGIIETAQEAVTAHRAAIEAECAADPQAAKLMWSRLRGCDLVCWCRLDQPCHADTLLELANRA